MKFPQCLGFLLKLPVILICFHFLLPHVSPDAAGMWSTAGCSVVTSLPDSTVCFCNHTTNFAVLLQVYEIKVSKQPFSTDLWGGCRNCKQHVVNSRGFCLLLFHDWGRGPPRRSSHYKPWLLSDVEFPFVPCLLPSFYSWWLGKKSYYLWPLYSFCLIFCLSTSAESTACQCQVLLMGGGELGSCSRLLAAEGRERRGWHCLWRGCNTVVSMEIFTWAVLTPQCTWKGIYHTNIVSHKSCSGRAHFYKINSAKTVSHSASTEICPVWV